jgi:hypothetical protein
MDRTERKRLVKEIEHSVNSGGALAILACLAQRQPNTFAEIAYFPDANDISVQVVGYGFSKVQWPDEWSPGYGRWLAVRRAAYDIVEQLQSQEASEIIVEDWGPQPLVSSVPIAVSA